MLSHLFFVFLLSITVAFPHEDRDEEDIHPVFKTSRSFLLQNPEEGTNEFWNQQAQQSIAQKLAQQLNTNVAKNVILFLGDGMSVPTTSSARVYLGGEEQELAFEKFPWTGLSKTYAVDTQVTDSASSATAYLGGVKANYGTIGVNAQVLREDCIAQANPDNHVLSIAYHSQNFNKSTGLVTTARVTHASPAGVYAHIADRDWETDAKVTKAGGDPALCSDIAYQLVYGETGSRLDVILGGGRTRFLPKDVRDEYDKKGKRTDGLNLIQDWLNIQASNGETARYVTNRTGLVNVPETTTKLLGLFSNTHMDYNLERDSTVEPSLTEMTEAAINVLSKGDNGYFLFVEGAKIDMGHHAAQAKLALDETIEFSNAVQRAVELTSESDTLIVVTADHAHTLSYSGYAERGNDIFAFGGDASDDLPYFTLNYANGPGYAIGADGTRPDHTKDAYDSKDYLFPGVAPLSSETHGGDDVAIYAKGPQSHLFSGVNEENVIPHLMSYASCVGDGLTACDKEAK